jgi:hypothetical protein
MPKIQQCAACGHRYNDRENLTKLADHGVCHMCHASWQTGHLCLLCLTFGGGHEEGCPGITIRSGS